MSGKKDEEDSLSGCAGHGGSRAMIEENRVDPVLAA